MKRNLAAQSSTFLCSVFFFRDFLITKHQDFDQCYILGLASLISLVVCKRRRVASFVEIMIRAVEHIVFSYCSAVICLVIR